MGLQKPVEIKRTTDKNCSTENYLKKEIKESMTKKHRPLLDLVVSNPRFFPTHGLKIGRCEREDFSTLENSHLHKNTKHSFL